MCVNLARELFTSKERQESNVKGKRGKKKLDAAKMKETERNAFQYTPWPLESNTTLLGGITKKRLMSPAAG